MVGLYPKSGQQYVVHVMQLCEEPGLLYHNVRVQPISASSRKFLLVRFAWTIFPHQATILNSSDPRLLLL